MTEHEQYLEARKVVKEYEQKIQKPSDLLTSPKPAFSSLVRKMWEKYPALRNVNYRALKLAAEEGYNLGIRRLKKRGM